MTRYFLHIHNSTISTKDDEGVEVPDLETARARAREGIRSMVAEEARRGVIDLRGRIDIADQDGRVLDVVPYRDALELHFSEGEA